MQADCAAELLCLVRIEDRWDLTGGAVEAVLPTIIDQNVSGTYSSFAFSTPQLVSEIAMIPFVLLSPESETLNSVISIAYD
jgi:hypothetical protein